jgi:pimeloyl-ACP methyl ester carboxylesterase
MDVYAKPQTLAPVTRRRRLNLRVQGDGSPTLVLAAGYLGLTIDWALVQPYVGARSVAFDNAGLGFSDAARGPRTSTAIVEDLRAALRGAGIDPPYVLVGHSAGGLRMRLFAARYPDEVAGMVMVDTVLADWEQRLYGGACTSLAQDRDAYRKLLRMSLAGTLTPSTPEYVEHIGLPHPVLSPAVNEAFHEMWTRPSYLQTAISESLHLKASTAEEAAADRRELGDMPLVILSAGQIASSPMIQTKSHLDGWYAMHEEIAALSTRSQRRMIDCGHNIPIERPRDVVAAIKDVLAMTRESAG